MNNFPIPKDLLVFVTTVKKGSLHAAAEELRQTPAFDNKPIHGVTGLKYEAEDKANAIADSLEDQFRTHKPDDDYLQHHKMVRRRVLNFDHTLHQSECVDFTSSETRRLIGRLKAKTELLMK